MRNTFAQTLYRAAQQDKRICAIVADISPAGAMDEFRHDYPDRFINVGVAEQVMIGMAAGMAARGMKPFAYTIATFALYRPFEFIRDDLAYQSLPVTVVGIGGGVTYSQLGATHHAMEDVAVACAVPNLRVIAPCDPLETAAATDWCARNDGGPVYLRLGKAGEPSISEKAPTPWDFGKVRYIKGGREACVVGYGPILKMGMQAAEGQDVAVVSVSTLKPLDVEGLGTILRKFPRVVIVEEMVRRGGLAEAMQALAYRIGARCDIQVLTLQDRFSHHYGKHEEVLADLGITADKVRDKLNG